MAARRGDGVAVTGVTNPHHGVARGIDGIDEIGKHGANFLGAVPRDDADSPRGQARIQFSKNGEHLVNVGRWSDLDAQRVFDPRQEFDVRAINLSSAIAYPELMSRTVVEITGE